MISKEERDKRIEERKRGIRRTDAKVSGDMVDGTLKFMNDEPRAYADYPETLLFVLKCWVTLFSFPHSNIPTKKSKNYEFWLKQLQEILNMCNGSEELVGRVMKRSYKRWKETESKYKVWMTMPIKGKRLYEQSLMEIKSELKDEYKVPEKKEKDENWMTYKELKTMKKD